MLEIAGQKVQEADGDLGPNPTLAEVPATVHGPADAVDFSREPSLGRDIDLFYEWPGVQTQARPLRH
jgi:hypothetical protein